MESLFFALMMPFSPESLSPGLRQSYIDTWWHAHADPFVLACHARHVGYPLGCPWDVRYGMPELMAFSPGYRIPETT